MSGLSLRDLPTPSAIVDESRLNRNIDRMQSRVRSLGVRFRQHVKTAKCIEIATRVRDAGSQGITVSTLMEAEAFFDAGFDDVLYPVGISPQKLPAVRSLRERGCGLTIVIDSLAAARTIAADGHRFDVMIEIDSDGRRAGVKPDSPSLIEIGRALHDGSATLKGAMTHAGASYECHTPEALAAMAEQERSLCVLAARRLREAGLPCPEVSVGSTPTALSARNLDGVTEVRAGVYVFHDLVMRNIGVCSIDDIALSILTTVIGHRADKGWILTDAGWMAMSRDRGTHAQAIDYGYGAVCDEVGRPIDDFIVVGASQEHGIIARRQPRASDGDLVQRFPLGTRLRVLPNHACATAAQFTDYAVLGGDGTIKTWPRINGW